MDGLSQIVDILIPNLGQRYSSISSEQSKAAQRIIVVYATKVFENAGIELVRAPRCRIGGYNYNEYTTLRIDLNVLLKNIGVSGWNEGTLRINPRLSFYPKKNSWTTNTKVDNCISMWPSEMRNHRKIRLVGEGIADAIYRTFSIYSAPSEPAY
jgi:hypothetical protein